jgi:hypothetical protein
MRYRVYFNRLNEAPQVWSVDEGDQSSEINVSSVAIAGCEMHSAVNLDETVNRDRPKAWFEVDGRLVVEGGVACIYPT